MLVIESKTECPRHSESTIVRCAAAESDDDFFRVARGRIQNHFANAKRSCQLGIQFVRPQSPHSGGFAHLHHREFAIVDPTVSRFDFATERIVRFAFHPRTAERLRNYFGSSFAAVRHRYDVDLCIRQNFPQTVSDCIRNFARAQRAFEFVRRD